MCPSLATDGHDSAGVHVQQGDHHHHRRGAGDLRGNLLRVQPGFGKPSTSWNAWNVIWNVWSNCENYGTHMECMKCGTSGVFGMGAIREAWTRSIQMLTASRFLWCNVWSAWMYGMYRMYGKVGVYGMRGMYEIYKLGSLAFMD